MSNEYSNNIVTLTDEDGREIQFEHFGSVEVDGTVYVGLIELFDDPQKQLESDGTLFILKTVEDDSGEEIFVTIDDEELQVVSKVFEQNYEDLILD